jgi:hypothetical protein
MWRYLDDSEREWDVVVGRESWGTFFAIFVPLTAGPLVRQSALAARSERGAYDELDALDAQAWSELFRRSDVKSD